MRECRCGSKRFEVRAVAPLDADIEPDGTVLCVGTHLRIECATCRRCGQHYPAEAFERFGLVMTIDYVEH